MKKNLKLKTFLIFFILIILYIYQTPFSFAQIEQEAVQAIQQGNNKLVESLSLLEEASLSVIKLREIIQKVDNARQLLAEAQSYFDITQFTLSFQKANEAIDELDTVIEEITSKLNIKTRNNWIIFSFIGMFFAVSAVFSVIFFRKKFYPWYLKKKMEDYESLEIKYPKKEEGT